MVWPRPVTGVEHSTALAVTPDSVPTTEGPKTLEGPKQGKTMFSDSFGSFWSLRDFDERGHHRHRPPHGRQRDGIKAVNKVTLYSQGKYL